MPPEDDKQREEKAKSDAAAMLMTIMKEQSLATLGLRAALDDVREAVLDLVDEARDLNVHITGLNVMLARQTYVEDELLSIMIGDPKATPPVPGHEPTTVDRLKVIQEYEARLEKEAALEAEQEQKQKEAEALAVPAKPVPKETPIITSSPPSMSRPHHPLPIVRPPTTGGSPVAPAATT
jgi:hypothetical protein